MEFTFTWGALSGLLIAISGIPYAWGIYTGKIKRPVTSAWGIWTILGLIFLLSSYDAGARIETTLLAPLAGFIDPLVIFLLSLRYGEKSWSRLETYCVATCLATIAVWQSLESALYGLIGACIADSMGTIPQIKKVFKEPGDEPWFPWVAFSVGSAINFLAIQNWEIEQYLYPTFMTIASSFIAIPVALYHIKESIRKRNLLNSI